MKKILTALWRVFANISATIVAGIVSYVILDNIMVRTEEENGEFTGYKCRK